MPNSSAQRRHPRHPLVLSILYKSKDPAPVKVGVGWTRDVSDGGACLELAEPLPFATPLSVILQTDQGSLGVEGKVVWVGGPAAVGGGTLHGVAFLDATPEQLRALWALIARRGQARQAAVRVPVKLPAQGGRGPAHPGRDRGRQPGRAFGAPPPAPPLGHPDRDHPPHPPGPAHAGGQGRLGRIARGANTRATDPARSAVHEPQLGTRTDPGPLAGGVANGDPPEGGWAPAWAVIPLSQWTPSKPGSCAASFRRLRLATCRNPC
ncbi:MAG: PilZ domain-containing protein [candidate division NC10 bacterium]|nr:PilZ domain-containing protein [candidate division NC10 bacterium]